MPDPEVGKVVFEKAIGREPTKEEAEALMRRRLDHLPEEVESSPGFVVKDGVVELLERLQADGILLGLTTGNVEEAAQIKLARADLNRFFSFGGYGSDSPDRTELTEEGARAGEALSGDASISPTASHAATRRATWRADTGRASGSWASPPASTRSRTWSRPAPTQWSIRS